MRVDSSLIANTTGTTRPAAAAAEGLGFDGVWTTDSNSDAFLQALAAVVATDRLEVGTAIAVAFARSPMTVAYSVWELAEASQGRFILGLGTQVKAHIERRFSMPWSAAVPRLREYLAALDAIFDTWRTGNRLDFAGDHYSFNLMTPAFSPPRHDYRIPVAIAAVGPVMAKLAGQQCDGVILHPFTNQSYLDDTALPAVQAGLDEAGRARSDFFTACPLFMVMGDDDRQLAVQKDAARAQIAFYASTPAYRAVLEAVGYGALQPELQQLSREGKFADMGSLIDDTLLGEIALIGEPEEMPALVQARYGGRLDRISSYLGWPELDQDRMNALVAAFHASA